MASVNVRRIHCAEAQAAVAPSVVQLRAQLEQLAGQMQAQRTRLGSAHPEVQSLNRQFADGQRALSADIARVVAATEAEQHAASEQVMTLEGLLNQAKAKVAQDEAQLAYDEAEYQRNLRLASTGAVSRSDLDKTSAARNVDVANIAADKAAVVSRQLDLEYTKIIAPVSGRVSRYVVTVGNLIQSGDQASVTLLTTIVSVDPMYAYYDVDERTVQRISQLIREGRLRAPAQRSPCQAP